MEPQVAPADFPVPLRSTLDAERGVLVGHHVILVFRVERLQVRRDVDVFRGQGGGGWSGEVFDQVGVVGGVEMEVGGRGVARLCADGMGPSASTA